MGEDLNMVQRRLVMTITFPGGTPLDIQDAVLKSVTLTMQPLTDISYRPPASPAPAQDAGMKYDTRRVKAYKDKDYWGKNWKNRDDALRVSIDFPEWMPKEIPPQAEKKIVEAAEVIVNEYLSRRLAGSE